MPLAEPYYRCWSECSEDRTYDAGGNPLGIPRSSVTDWLDEEEFTIPAERREFRFMVRLLDARWRKLQRIHLQRVANRGSANPKPVETDDEEEDDD